MPWRSRWRLLLVVKLYWDVYVQESTPVFRLVPLSSISFDLLFTPIFSMQFRISSLLNDTGIFPVTSLCGGLSLLSVFIPDNEGFFVPRLHRVVSPGQKRTPSTSHRSFGLPPPIRTVWFFRPLRISLLQSIPFPSPLGGICGSGTLGEHVAPCWFFSPLFLKFLLTELQPSQIVTWLFL